MTILARTFTELQVLFSTEDGQQSGDRSHEESHNSAASGAKHKAKAALKEAINLDTPKQTPQAQSVTEATEKGKKQKKEKQPLLDQDGKEVKRPLSAYMLFANFRRPNLKQDHNEMSLADLTKVISAEWQGMNELQQKVIFALINLIDRRGTTRPRKLVSRTTSRSTTRRRRSALKSLVSGFEKRSLCFRKEN